MNNNRELYPSASPDERDSIKDLASTYVTQISGSGKASDVDEEVESQPRRRSRAATRMLIEEARERKLKARRRQRRLDESRGRLVGDRWRRQLRTLEEEDDDDREDRRSRRRRITEGRSRRLAESRYGRGYIGEDDDDDRAGRRRRRINEWRSRRLSESRFGRGYMGENDDDDEDDEVNIVVERRLREMDHEDMDDDGDDEVNIVVERRLREMKGRKGRMEGRRMEGRRMESRRGRFESRDEHRRKRRLEEALAEFELGERLDEAKKRVLRRRRIAESRDDRYGRSRRSYRRAY